MTFRVLCLDGGGIKGVYSASFLAKLAEMLELRSPLADYFDLIVGTSTGGLLGLALALHKEPHETRDFYIKHGPAIFPSGRISGGLLKAKHIAYPKHDSSVLERAVKQYIGEETLLDDARCPLVLTAFNAASGKPVCFKTRHHDDFAEDYKRPAWEVAMATAAAPTFYRAFEVDSGTDYIDGGVWANCPAMVGAIEAIHRFGICPSDVRILNIGTTRAPFHVGFQQRRGGAWQNVSLANRAVVDLLLEASAQSTLNMARQLVGADNVVVVDDDVRPGRFEMDDAGERSMRDLRSLGEEKAKAAALNLRPVFFRDVVERQVLGQP